MDDLAIVRRFDQCTFCPATSTFVITPNVHVRWYLPVIWHQLRKLPGAQPLACVTFDSEFALGLPAALDSSSSLTDIFSISILALPFFEMRLGVLSLR